MVLSKIEKNLLSLIIAEMIYLNEFDVHYFQNNIKKQNLAGDENDFKSNGLFLGV